VCVVVYTVAGLVGKGFCQSVVVSVSVLNVCICVYTLCLCVCVSVCAMAYTVKGLVG
jgi:hypothetical protein